MHSFYFYIHASYSKMLDPTVRCIYDKSYIPCKDNYFVKPYYDWITAYKLKTYYRKVHL